MKVWYKRMIIGVVILALVGTGVLIFGQSSDKMTKDVATQAVSKFQPLDTSSTKVVAEYNGGTVSEGELNAYVNMIVYFQPQLGAYLSDKAKIEEMKQQQLQDIAVQSYIASKVADSKDDLQQVNERVKEFEKHQQQVMKSKDSLDKMIVGKGFTVDQLKKVLIQGQKAEKYCAGKLKGMTFDYFKARHILIATELGGSESGKEKKKRTDVEAKKIADEVKSKLEKGADFAKLAKQYSDDPGSKDRGGIIEGSASAGQFVPEFAQAARTLAINKISAPVKTSFGYHVMKVESRKKENMDKAPEQVKQLKKQEIFQAIIKNELKFKSLLPVTKPASK